MMNALDWKPMLSRRRGRRLPAGVALSLVLVLLLPPGLAVADLKPLLSRPNGTIVPLDAVAGKDEQRFFGETVLFIYDGPDGRLVYSWELPVTASGPPFGRISLQADPADAGDELKGTGPLIPVAADAVVEWTGDAGASRSQWEAPAGGKFRMARSFQIGGDIANLKIAAQLVGKSLVLEVLCDKPVVGRCLSGSWGRPDWKPAPEPPAPPKGKVYKDVDVPFLPEKVRAFPNEKLFASALSDWRISNETANGNYAELSGGSRNLVVARFIYTASWNIQEVLPNIPNEPSPFREEMGRRSVFEFGDEVSSEFLVGYVDKLAARGMRDYTLVLGEWQFKGPDSSLPQHFPAKGNEEALKAFEAMTDKVARSGIRLALQEEYTDMWPDFEKFSDRYLCRAADGQPVKGHRNSRAREPENEFAFRIRPELMAKFADDQASDIHRNYHTSAAYLHRHSSAPPEQNIDFTAGEPGAGMARPTIEANAKLFLQARKAHAGPVLGEGGAPSWIYTGFLDGVHAEPGAGWKSREGMSLPLLVDFELLRVHPLQVNYGMGSLSNWQQRPDETSGEVPWGMGTPMILMDQYRMQQLAFGHASFIGTPLRDDEGTHCLEQNLVLPVTRAYAGANVSEIAYLVNGEWSDTSTAVWANQLNVVRVRYDNGLELIANQSEEKIEAGGVTLPQFGWVATQGDALLAYTAMKDGALVDFAKTAGGSFANARRLADWQTTSRFDAFADQRGTDDAWRQKNLNDSGALVDFGLVKTDGCVNLRREASDWVVTTFPRTADFTLLVNASGIKAPHEVTSAEGTDHSVKPEPAEGGAWWRLPLNGAVDYRFPAGR